MVAADISGSGRVVPGKQHLSAIGIIPYSLVLLFGQTEFGTFTLAGMDTMKKRRSTVVCPPWVHSRPAMPMLRKPVQVSTFGKVERSSVIQ